MSNLRDFIQGEAELGTESDDDDFDEETGESKPKRNGPRRDFEDSSEEDEDEDEEEAAKVCGSSPTGLSSFIEALTPL